MTEFFPGVKKIKYEGPIRRTRWPSSTTTPRRKCSARPWPSTCGSPSATGTRSRDWAATRSGRARSSARTTTPPTRWRSPR